VHFRPSEIDVFPPHPTTHPLEKFLRIQKRKYGQHYTDWKQRTGTREVFDCEKCSLSDKTAEIIVLQISSSDSAAKEYDCKNSIFPVVSSSVREDVQV
jgi:hypothetical protein